MQGCCRLPAAKPAGRPAGEAARPRVTQVIHREHDRAARAAQVHHANRDVGHRRSLGRPLEPLHSATPDSLAPMLPAAGGRRLNQCPAGPQTEKHAKKQAAASFFCSSSAPNCLPARREREREGATLQATPLLSIPCSAAEAIRLPRRRIGNGIRLRMPQQRKKASLIVSR